MSEQNFKNHSRFIILWHIITPFIILVILAMSIINLVHTGMHAHDLHMWLPIILIPVVMLVLWAYARIFALKAQDRAIRAEENFRYFILTGKPLDKQLSIGQIIALRFASDEEMPALAKKAVSENLTSKQIKQAIQNWRGDFHRV
jgi:Zn-dependent protease with chaperone function